MVTQSIERAQRRVELQNFEARKRLLEYDDVMNQQREVLYSLRLFALEGGEDLKAEAIRMIEAALDRFVEETAAGGPDDLDPQADLDGPSPGIPHPRHPISKTPTR